LGYWGRSVDKLERAKENASLGKGKKTSRCGWTSSMAIWRSISTWKAKRQSPEMH
jgi:hypothetical protein